MGVRSYFPAVGAVKRLHTRARRVVRRAAAHTAAASLFLSIVVPVFNGADTIGDSLDELDDFRRSSHQESELIIVDDGSDADTGDVLSEFAARAPGVSLLRNERNRGKGYSVARGLLAARGRYRVFTDADLAYPADQISRVVGVLEAGHDLAVACRVLPDSRYLMSPAFFRYLYTRHVMSRVFNGMVRAALIPDVLDAQAGLKGLTAEAADDLVPRLTIAGFAMDVELLYAAALRGYDVAQVPVFFRYDSEPTTVRFARDTVRMVSDLGRIRWNAFRGRYG